jgi:molybdate transport system substrate-binding protein
LRSDAERSSASQKDETRREPVLNAGRIALRRSIATLLVTAITAAFPTGIALGEPAPDRTTRNVSVFAAASLTAAFRGVATAFEAAHPGMTVTLNFAGSPTLGQQIREGAPADVFAAADEPTMQRLVAAGAVEGTPQVFARSALRLVVAAGNPHRIGGLADVTRPGLVVVLCGETVPCGRYAREAFRKADVTPPPGSRELDVKAVVSKVVLGEADAGVVYATDVRAAGPAVEGIALPAAHDVVARYPIAVLRDAAAPAVARAFVAFVLSDPGIAVLGEHGFLRP